MKTVAVLLNEAADLIEENGWIQYADTNPKGEFCALGAIIKVAQINRRSVEPMRLALVKCLPAPNKAVTQWNDRSDQTKENVVKTMRACAKGLKKNATIPAGQ